jgi:hypothetical protein
MIPAARLPHQPEARARTHRNPKRERGLIVTRSVSEGKARATRRQGCPHARPSPTLRLSLASLAIRVAMGPSIFPRLRFGPVLKQRLPAGSAATGRAPSSGGSPAPGEAAGGYRRAAGRKEEVIQASCSGSVRKRPLVSPVVMYKPGPGRGIASVGRVRRESQERRTCPVQLLGDWDGRPRGRACCNRLCSNGLKVAWGSRAVVGFGPVALTPGRRGRSQKARPAR